MRQRAIRAAHAKICRRVRTRYTLAKPIAVQGLFNQRCHENCVEYVRTHPEQQLSVIECIYIDGGEPILHYMLHDVEADAYLEITLGWRTEGLEYYPIRVIDPHSFPTIHIQFTLSIEDWLHEFVGWFGRSVLGIKRVL